MAISFIRQVWENSFNEQKLVTIPKDCGLNNGDFVMIKKVAPPLKESMCLKCNKPYKEHTLKELYAHGLFGVK